MNSFSENLKNVPRSGNLVPRSQSSVRECRNVTVRDLGTRLTLGLINSLRNGLIVPSNRFRVSRLAFRIISVSFLGVNKDFSE